jgi:hypothetical protein
MPRDGAIIFGDLIHAGALPGFAEGLLGYCLPP